MYNNNKYDLWPFQSGAVEQVRDAVRAGHKNILLVSPTGSGKTVIGSHLIISAHDKLNNSLFFAHRRELIHQSSEKLDQCGVPHGLILAGEKQSLMARTQVASIQSFLSRVIKDDRVMNPQAALIEIDEAHHAGCDSYQKIRDEYPDAIIVGLTATPCLGDGSGLGNIWDVMIEVATVQELVDLGYLVPTKVIAPSIPDITGVKINSSGEYDEQQAVDRMSPIIGDIVEDWLKYAKGRKTIVFTRTVGESVYLAEQFEMAGVRVAHLDGETPNKKRDQIIADLEDGLLDVVTNCQVLTEGYDCPSISCVVLARLVKSFRLWLQMVGRGMRAEDGKKDCLVMDHGGAVYEHGFPEDPAEWSLDPNEKISTRRLEKKAERKDPVEITCRFCWHVFVGHAYCPECGQKPAPQATKLNTKEGRLGAVLKVKEKKVISAEQRFWNKCLYQCSHRGAPVGAAAHMFKKKFGVWPRELDNLPDKDGWKRKASELTGVGR